MKYEILRKCLESLRDDLSKKYIKQSSDKLHIINRIAKALKMAEIEGPRCQNCGWPGPEEITSCNRCMKI